jgi:hypothetical protein
MDDFALRIHRLIAKADGDDEGIPLDEDEDADAIGDLEHQLGGVLKRLKRAGAKKKGKLSKKRLKKSGRKRKLAAVGGAEDFHADPGASGSGALPGALPLPLPSDPLPTLGEPMIEPPLAPLDDDVAEADPPEHLPMFVKGGYTYAPYQKHGFLVFKPGHCNAHCSRPDHCNVPPFKCHLDRATGLPTAKQPGKGRVLGLHALWLRCGCRHAS